MHYELLTMYLVPVAVVVGGDVNAVTVVRSDHRVLAGVNLTAGPGNYLIRIKLHCEDIL